jgi:polyhydroxybutyrate depolymerase
VLAVLALSLLAILAAGCGVQSAQAAHSATDSRMVKLRVDGRERSYLLEPALGMSKGKKAALVAVLHQEGGTPAGVAKETALQELRRAGATLVYPAGVDHSWDAGKCCGVPSRQGVDDVRFLDAVFADAAKQTPVDKHHEALVGYSSGGMLTYHYVCARPGRLAVAVVVSGSLESPCDANITVPDVLTLHGKADGTIGLNRPIFITKLGLAPRPAASTLGILTTSAGCEKPKTTQVLGAEVRRWEGCRGGTVEALLIPDAGHGWGNLDGTRRTLAFLRLRLLAS